MRLENISATAVHVVENLTKVYGVRCISIEVNVLVIKSNHLSHDEVTVDVDRDVSTYQLPCTAVIGLFFILVIGPLEEMSPICVA